MRHIINPFKSLIFMMILVSLLSLMPFAIFARFIYLRSLEKFEESLTNTIMVETQSYASLLKRDVDMIWTQMYDTLSNDSVISLSIRPEWQSPDTRFAQEISFIQSSLQSKQNSHVILDSLIIYYPNIQKQLTSSSVRNYTDEEAEQLAAMISDYPEGRALYDNALIYWFEKPFRYNTKEGWSSVLVAASLSSENMEKYINCYIGSMSESLFAVYVYINQNDLLFAATSDLYEQLELPACNEETPVICEYIIHNDMNYLLTGSYINEQKMTLYQITPLDSLFISLEKYKHTMLIFQYIIILLAIIFTLLLYLMIYRPISHARQSLSRIESGKLGTRMGKAWYREFQDMFNQFDSMSAYIQDLIEREYELQLLSARAELKQMQYQISPHLLYNTYFMLRGLLEDEKFDKAKMLADIIGRYLRYITTSSKETATLGEEIDHARAYAQIQQLRYSRHVLIDFSDCPAEFLDIAVPRLILQPLIENAFEHGIKHNVNNGIIKVAFSGDVARVLVTVEDNGKGLTTEELYHLRDMLTSENSPEDSIALYNIHRRLCITYGPGSGLAVSNSALGGLCCTLILMRSDIIV